jgi:UDP:flavonoid glycosyltransferase YjiC (YdhE family)
MTLKFIIFKHIKKVYNCLSPAILEADLIVAHPLAVVVPLLAEYHQKPWIATVLAPMSFMSVYDPPRLSAMPLLYHFRWLGSWVHQLVFWLIRQHTLKWQQSLDQFRQELGLASQTKSALFEGQFSPLLTLALFDAPLAKPQADWPLKHKVCGCPCYQDEDFDPAALAEFKAFIDKGEPPLVFALGSSAVWLADDFWLYAMQVTEHLGMRAVLITGPKQPQPLNEDIKVFSYLPYQHVFSYAAVVVHQGGIGTLAHALRSARPQLIVPVGFDQPDNANRAKRLKVAKVIPFNKVTVSNLSKALHGLLHNPQYAINADYIAEQLRPNQGADSAAEVLMQYSNPTIRTYLQAKTHKEQVPYSPVPWRLMQLLTQ